MPSNDDVISNLTMKADQPIANPPISNPVVELTNQSLNAA